MRAKRTLIALAAVAGAGVVVAAAALNPRLQTWAVRRALATGRGRGVELASVALRPGRCSVEGLRLVRAGLVLTAPRVDADLAVVPAALGEGYRFEKLLAHGWTVDLTGAPPPSESSPEVPSSLAARTVGAVLVAFDLPSNLALSGVDLEGDVIFPDENGRRAGRVHVVVTGGGLSPGAEGRFQCRAEAALDDASASVSRVSVKATLSVSSDAAGALQSAELKADAEARGHGVPSGIGLTIAASTAHKAGANAYAVSLIKGSETIAAVQAQHPDGAQTLDGTWRLNLRDTDLAPFALGRSMPMFYAAGSGSVEVDASSGDVHAAGKLEATADRLGVIGRDLGALGSVRLSADFDVARLGDSLRVARLDMGLYGSTPVASVRALQSFEFNTTTGELRVAVPSGDLVGISVTGLPLSWFRSALRGVGVSGGGVSGELVLRAEDGRLALRTKAPLSASGVSVTRDSAVLADGLEISAFILADYASQGWQVQLAPLAIRSDGLKLLSLEARFGRLAGAGGAIKSAGSWSVSLPALLAEPAASGLAGLASGEASGSFEASLDATSEVRLKLAVRNLVASSGSTAGLPAVDSEIRADFEPGGKVSFSVPLKLDYGSRASEIALKGSVSPGAAGYALDASLEGSQVTLEEMASLAQLSRGGAPQGAEHGAAPAQRRPFWPPVHGTFALRFEGVSLPRVELRDVRGTLRVDPESIEVVGGSANLAAGGAARLDGKVTFSPAAPLPLSFGANIAVDGLDSGALFREADPSRPPLIEGKFDCEGRVTGSGTEPSDLLDSVQGDVRLVSRLGTFRALHAGVVDQIRQAPSKLVDALDTVSSLFGKKADKIGQALVETANGISEIHYDQMTLSVERGADLDLRLTAINMIAPEARITGSGRITHAAGVPLQDQPLSADLELGVRGNLGKVLDVIGLATDDRDALGYARLAQPIHLGGTLRSVDQSQWREMLVQASLKKGGGLFDKLLGR